MEASEVEQWKDLYAAGGQLFFQFAALETYLSACLRFNLTWKIDTSRWSDNASFAAAVYGSQRFKASRDTVKRVMRQEGKLTPDQMRAIESMMEQFAHIAGLRDKLAHQHTMKHPLQDDAWLITDTFSTRNLSARQTWVITTKDIRMATHDLFAGREALGDFNASGVLLKHAPTAPPAWRYTPSALTPLDPETANALREQRLQPQPSEA